MSPVRTMGCASKVEMAFCARSFTGKEVFAVSKVPPMELAMLAVEPRRKRLLNLGLWDGPLCGKGNWDFWVGDRGVEGAKLSNDRCGDGEVDIIRRKEIRTLEEA